MTPEVHIVRDFLYGGHRGGHRVIVIRHLPGRPSEHLLPGGEWEPLSEAAAPSEPGFVLPEGALDAIVQEWLKVAPPNVATERHLTDALAVRDRLLALVERGAFES